MCSSWSAADVKPRSLAMFSWPKCRTRKPGSLIRSGRCANQDWLLQQQFVFRNGMVLLPRFQQCGGEMRLVGRIRKMLCFQAEPGMQLNGLVPVGEGIELHFLAIHLAPGLTLRRRRPGFSRCEGRLACGQPKKSNNQWQQCLTSFHTGGISTRHKESYMGYGL